MGDRPARRPAVRGRQAADVERLVYGVHPVAELVSLRPRDVDRIYVARQRTGGLGRVLRGAREAGIPISHVDSSVLTRKLGAGAVHQGLAALVAAWPYVDGERLCEAAARKDDGLLVLVDGVTDPGNLGAILRTCAAAGVDGVLLGGERTVGLTPAAVKTSAGTVERVPVAREPRPGPRLAWLAERGFATVGLAAEGDVAWDALDLRGRTVLVAGSEGRGVRSGVLRACARHAAIPLAPGIESLNVAVAVGVLLFEAIRQRRATPLETPGSPW